VIVAFVDKHREFRRREVLLSAMIDDYFARERGRLRHFYKYELFAKVFKAVFRGKTLREMTTGDVDRYIARRRGGKLSDVLGEDVKLCKGAVAPATINRELAFLRRIFNVAIEDGKAETNPVRSKLFAKKNNSRLRYLANAEEAALRKQLTVAEWSLVAVAIHTGLRQGEQFNLLWDNVDFATGFITVPRSKHGELRRVRMNDTPG